VAHEAVADENQVPAERHVYEEPALRRLGLLRLMTRYSVTGEHDDDGWELGHFED
jgi:hypothetical protein